MKWSLVYASDYLEKNFEENFLPNSALPISFYCGKNKKTIIFNRKTFNLNTQRVCLTIFISLFLTLKYE